MVKVNRELVRSVYFPKSIILNETFKPIYSFNEKNSRFYSLARFALEGAITEIGLSKGDKILIPSFICRDVLASFRKSEITVLYYDVNESLTPVSLKMEEGVKAILAVNFFGFPFPYEIFSKFCEENDLVLIEDNAHGFLSKDEQGRWLGERGDYSIFSLRKTLPLVAGGFLKSNKVEGLSLPSLPSKSLIPWAKTRERKIFSLIGVGFIPKFTTLIRIVRKMRTGSSVPMGSIETERVIPGDGITFNYNEVLPHIDSEYEIQRRRQLYLCVVEILESLKVNVIYKDLNNAAPMGVPFFCSAEEISKVQKVLRQYCLECFQWPDIPSDVQGKVPAFYKDVWCVRFLW